MNTPNLAAISFEPVLTKGLILEQERNRNESYDAWRRAMATLTRNLDQLLAAWKKEPEAFTELFEGLSDMVDKAKAEAELLDAAFARLCLVAVAAGIGDESKEEPQPRARHHCM